MDIATLPTDIGDIPFGWSLRREWWWRFCQRAAFLRYYAARGGHDADTATPERRRIHYCKQLTTVESYVVGLLTSTFLELGSRPPTAWGPIVWRRFARERVWMTTGACELDHAKPMLQELYLKQDAPEKIWERLETMLRDALTGFQACGELKTLSCRPFVQRFAEPEPVEINALDVPIWSAPLFGWRAGGRAAIYQLMLREPDEATCAKLLLLHKYYTIGKLRMPPERTESRLLFPDRPSRKLDPMQLNLSAAIESLSDAVGAMRLTAREYFPTEFPANPDSCPACPFQFLCAGASSR